MRDAPRLACSQRCADLEPGPGPHRLSASRRLVKGVATCHFPHPPEVRVGDTRITPTRPRLARCYKTFAPTLLTVRPHLSLYRDREERERGARPPTVKSVSASALPRTARRS